LPSHFAQGCAGYFCKLRSPDLQTPFARLYNTLEKYAPQDVLLHKQDGALTQR